MRIIKSDKAISFFTLTANDQHYKHVAHLRCTKMSQSTNDNASIDARIRTQRATDYSVVLCSRFFFLSFLFLIIHFFKIFFYETKT